jgi:hypothetical protein
LSRDTVNEINLDEYVIIENVSDEVDGALGKVQPEYFTENKIENNTFQALDTSKVNQLHYVQFDNGINGKFNNNYDDESSSNTSSNESISFRKIVLTPIEENEVKLSNGY